MTTLQQVKSFIFSDIVERKYGVLIDKPWQQKAMEHVKKYTEEQIKKAKK